MTAFWLVVVLSVAIFIVKNMKDSHRRDLLDLCTPIIKDWIIENNGRADSLMVANYKDDSIAVNSGAHIFIGQFEQYSGQRLGFYIEIISGTIKLSRLYNPSGIVSFHRSLIIQAKARQETLFYMLDLTERNHHKKDNL